MAGRRFRAAAAVALLLVAAALPAALGQDCAATLANAIKQCRGPMEVAMLAAGGMVPADVLATVEDKAGTCCAAARRVFDANYMNTCGCDPSVLKATRHATPAALETMRLLVADRCSAGASAAAFPLSCPNAAALAPSGVNPPPGGTGSVCKTTDKCKTLCPSKYKGDDAKLTAALTKFTQKCEAKKNNGYCNTNNVTIPQPDEYKEGKGLSVCAVPEGSVPIVQNITVGSESCYGCCKPIGE
jgi:hypothetical protein